MALIRVIYFSETGNTKKMAELVAEGATESGTHDVHLTDVLLLDVKQLRAVDAFAFGSPDYFTYMAGQMKTMFDRALPLTPALKGKPFVTFISHGGGGGAIESLDRLGKSIGLEKVTEGVRSEGAPKAEVAEACRTLGRSLATALD